MTKNQMHYGAATHQEHEHVNAPHDFEDDNHAKKIKDLGHNVYGWPEPQSYKTEKIPKMTVAELIERLLALPPESETGELEVKIPIDEA